MSFDHQFLSFFWADFPKKIVKELSSLNMPKEAERVVFTSSDFLFQSFDNRTRKRGTFMFIITVFLLIVVSFAKEIITYSGSFSLSCGLVLFALMIILLYLFDRQIMKKWLMEYVCIIFILTFFCVWIVVAPRLLSCETRMLSIPVLNSAAVVLVILAIIIPVVWQLFVNWLYSNFYLNYVISTVSDEVREYNNALNYKPGDDIDRIKKCYKNLVVQRLATKSEDKPVTPLLNAFKNEVLKLNFYPNFGPLVRISWKEYRAKQKESERIKYAE